MAHQVEQMFSVIQTPWHRLGRIVQEAPNAEEAIKLAGLDWRVDAQAVYRVIEGQPQLIESHKLLTRSDNGGQLAIVGEGYTPLQNQDAFKFFNPFIESGDASFETAGSLRDGKTIWILAKLNRDPIDVGGGDIVDKYFLLSNGHDGTMALRTAFTPVRVVCANTLEIAHGSKGSRIRLLHSKQVKSNLERIQEIVNIADQTFEATAEQYRALVRTDVNQADIEKYVKIIFPMATIKDSERRAQAEKKQLETIQRLFETGRGVNLKSANGTLWGLYNAVTEYLSYEAGRTDSSRLNSLWFGANKNKNDEALKVAVELAVG